MTNKKLDSSVEDMETRYVRKIERITRRDRIINQTVWNEFNNEREETEEIRKGIEGVDVKLRKTTKHLKLVTKRCI